MARAQLSATRVRARSSPLLVVQVATNATALAWASGLQRRLWLPIRLRRASRASFAQDQRVPSRARQVEFHQFSFWVFGSWVGKIEALVSRAGAVEA